MASIAVGYAPVVSNLEPGGVGKVMVRQPAVEGQRHATKSNSVGPGGRDGPSQVPARAGL